MPDNQYSNFMLRQIEDPRDTLPYYEIRYNDGRIFKREIFKKIDGETYQGLILRVSDRIVELGFQSEFVKMFNREKPEIEVTEAPVPEKKKEVNPIYLAVLFSLICWIYVILRFFIK